MSVVLFTFSPVSGIIIVGIELSFLFGVIV
nr:MAG TPA: hypothetical protein [Caudoviricetes sp.]